MQLQNCPKRTHEGPKRTHEGPKRTHEGPKRTPKDSKLASKGPRRISKGFTLIEIMIVVVILGILAALVVPNMIGKAGEARQTAAAADIRAIANSLDMYRLENFNYPSTDQGLKALVERPTGEPPAPNWSPTGYLRKLPKDPWGNDYLYISPGKNGAYDLRSLGGDGRSGGQDEAADIDLADL